MGPKYGPGVAGRERVPPTCSGHLRSHRTPHLPCFIRSLTHVAMWPALCLPACKQTLQAGAQHTSPVRHMSPETVQLIAPRLSSHFASKCQHRCISLFPRSV